MFLSEEVRDLSTAQRIRLALEELGPTFIKLGQILSTRRDIFDVEITDELCKLQDSVNAFKFEEAERIFIGELGIGFKDAFVKFNKKEIAAASIGQVYEGELRDGSKVIIKIQRPNIEETIKSDLEILRSLAKVIDEYYKDNIFSLKEAVEDFAISIIRELDYNYEGRNCEKFGEIFKNDKNIYIPKVHWKYTSTKILTLEKIDGIKIDDIKEMRKRNWNPKEIANVGAMAIMKQIFFHGFYHADPHPGNIFATDKEKISFIDFGIVGLIDNVTLDFITELFFACVAKDSNKIINSLTEYNCIDRNADIRKLREEINFFIHYYYNMPIKRLNVSEVLNDIMRFARKNKVRLPSQFAQLTKTLITIEGGGQILDPDYSISLIVKDFVKEFYLHSFEPKNIFLKSRSYIDEIKSDLKVIPRQIRMILKSLEKNEVKFTIDEIKFTNLEKEIRNMTNKLAISMIISSTIVGSSLVITTKTGKSIFGYPLIGLLGYSFATIMGLFLTISIIVSFKDKK